MTKTLPNPIEDALYSALDILNYPVSNTQKYRTLAQLFHEKWKELEVYKRDNHTRRIHNQLEWPIEPPISPEHYQLFTICHNCCTTTTRVPRLVFDKPLDRLRDIKAALLNSSLTIPFDPDFYIKGKRKSFVSPSELTVEEIVDQVDGPLGPTTPTT